MSHKRKIDKGNFIKIKNFLKGTINKMRKQDTDWRKILQIYQIPYLDKT